MLLGRSTDTFLLLDALENAQILTNHALFLCCIEILFPERKWNISEITSVWYHPRGF
jgi:hypothetical protein